MTAAIKTMVPPPCTHWCTAVHDGAADGWDRIANGDAYKMCTRDVEVGVVDVDGYPVEFRLRRLAAVDDDGLAVYEVEICDLSLGALSVDAAVALADALRSAADLARAGAR